MAAYKDKHPNHPEDLVICVNNSEKVALGRTCRGRTVAPRTRVIAFADILRLVDVTLDYSMFSAMGNIYKQSRGSCIGSPCSPVLCSITVLFDEVMWQCSFTRTMVSSAILVRRYVDNRLILRLTKYNPVAVQVLTDLEFYGSPVILEPENCIKYLGFNIDVSTGKVMYIQPSQEFQFRSTRSAASAGRLLASLQSRLYIVYRGSSSQQIAEDSANELAQSYVNRGFPKAAVAEILGKVRRRAGRERKEAS